MIAYEDATATQEMRETRLMHYDVNVFAKGVNPGTPATFADASVNVAGGTTLDESNACQIWTRPHLTASGRRVVRRAAGR